MIMPETEWLTEKKKFKNNDNGLISNCIKNGFSETIIINVI